MSYKFYYNGEYSLLGVNDTSPMWNMGASKFCWRQGGVTYRCPGATTRGTQVYLDAVTSGTTKTTYYINNSTPTICWHNGSTYYGARGSSSSSELTVLPAGSYAPSALWDWARPKITSRHSTFPSIGRQLTQSVTFSQNGKNWTWSTLYVTLSYGGHGDHSARISGSIVSATCSAGRCILVPMQPDGNATSSDGYIGNYPVTINKTLQFK